MRGPNVARVPRFGPTQFGFANVRGQRMTVFRGPRAFWRGSRRYQFVGLATLGLLTYGAYTYYPYGYAALSAPQCDGLTDDGCRLTWRDVPLEEGGFEPQCVQWCPQGYSPPEEPVVVATPAAVVGPAPVIAAPPAAPQAVIPPIARDTGCEMTGFADPELQGTSFTTAESFPALDQWKNQIGSVKVFAGTWDFYSDENFGGEVMRLAPGDYPTLGENWTYGIASFMCVNR
jgi:hypothetical protein